jgi:anti-sigma factor RsiW
MRCEHASHFLEEYAEGLLLPLDRAAVAEHVGDCPRCSGEVARAAALLRVLGDLPDAEVSDDFCARVMADLPEMMPAQQGTGHLVRWGLASAAALFAFVAAVAVLPRLGGPGVARETLQPVSASLRLGGEILGSAATMLAGALDAASATLIAAGLGPKALFALAFLTCNLALAAAVSRYRHACLHGAARPRSGPDRRG